ncbi:FprA family A-type flavoprotein [Christensenella sp. MSJ-20]|uniref:FprA family A-type flavoprotein n=1 Tax=Christensenella sp. MSJ-20 TaxID=2841518 RepID=UPI000D795ED5|nr:MAG: hypothetical protein DBY42_00340 [Bacillota bacterium]QWT54818.1 FprA family A-type flavoprotein [Christensenella sp. MSJ-20]
MKLTEHVRYIGVSDPDLRVFDVVMHTQYGTTYNSYYVKGTEKSAIIDTVKETFFDRWLEIMEAEGVDLGSLDYIVMNHTEPDHSGSIGRLLEKCPKAVVVASQAGLNVAKEIVNGPFESIRAKDGEIIDLGGVTLQTISAPFLHWPDSIFTYVKEDGVLMSCDAFGFHHAAPGVLEETMDVAELYSEQKYYFDVIMGPFKPHVQKAIAAIRDLDIRMICPSHGPVLNRDPMGAVNRYEEWSRPEAKGEKPQGVVAYVSCYGYTRVLAQAIARELTEMGADIRLMDVAEDGVDAVSAAIGEADFLALGSPTFNRDALLPIWDVLARTSCITNRNKKALAFGCFGWSGEAAGFLAQRMEQIGLKVVGTATCRMRPNQEKLDAVLETARKLME